MKNVLNYKGSSMSWKIVSNITDTYDFQDGSQHSYIVYVQDDAGVNSCTVFPADQTAAEGAMNSTSATGASASGYAWTWTSINGKL